MNCSPLKPERLHHLSAMEQESKEITEGGSAPGRIDLKVILDWQPPVSL